jgi:hypothetical protein
MTATLSPPRRAGAGRPTLDPADRLIRISAALVRKVEGFTHRLLIAPRLMLKAADAAGLTPAHLAICEDAAAILEAVQTWRAALDDIHAAGEGLGKSGDTLHRWRMDALAIFVSEDLKRIRRWHDGPEDTRPGGFWGPETLAAAMVQNCLNPLPTEAEAGELVAEILFLAERLTTTAEEGTR